MTPRGPDIHRSRVDTDQQRRRRGDLRAYNAVQPWWLGCGTAAFRAGHAIYRALLKRGRITDRVVGAVCAVPLAVGASSAGRAAMAAPLVLLTGIATVWSHEGAHSARRHRRASPPTGP